MRGAGCTVNDMWDGRIDARVERTKGRPLPSGRVGYVQAGCWVVAQLSVGLAVVLALNVTSIALSFAIVPVVAAYPLMKRVTDWPQLVLGVCFNWGAVVGYTATAGALSVPTVAPLYAAGILWTLLYDTIYAHQDTADDRALGLRSTALHFDRYTHPVLAVVAALMVAMLIAAGIGEGMGLWYYAAVAGVAGHLVWQLLRLNVGDKVGCWRLFVSNRWVGWLLLAGIVVDKAMASRDEVKEAQRADMLRRSAERAWGKSGYELLGEFFLQHVNHEQRTAAATASPGTPTHDG